MFKKLLTVVASTLIITPLAVNAEGTTTEIPVSVEGTETAKVTISSDNAEAMSAIVGDTTLEVKEGTDYAFQISYDEPVSYTYTLTQVAGDEADVTYDSNAYTAHVFVEAEEDGTLVSHVVVWKTDETSKSDGVHFTNVKESKETANPDATATPDTSKKSDKSADTSDNSHALLYGGVAIGACVLAVVALIAKEKEEKE